LQSCKLKIKLTKLEINN